MKTIVVLAAFMFAQTGFSAECTLRQLTKENCTKCELGRVLTKDINAKADNGTIWNTLETSDLTAYIALEKGDKLLVQVFDKSEKPLISGIISRSGGMEHYNNSSGNMDFTVWCSTGK